VAPERGEVFGRESGRKAQRPPSRQRGTVASA